MNKNTWLIAIATLIIGAGLGVGVTKAIDKKNQVPMVHTMVNNHITMDGMMKGMVESLKNRQGNEFDQQFLSEMIMHHQGAIEMANLALTNAEHQEIKDLAKNIISAQTSEINQMKQWQQSWFDQASMPSAWKVYSDKSGYEISFPKTWYSLDSTDSLQSAVSEYNITPKEPDYNTPGYLVQIVVAKGDMKTRLDQMAYKEHAQDINFNGYNAKKLILDKTTTIYLIERNGQVYQINYSFSDQFEIPQSEAEKVLGFFKFTK